MRDSKFNPHAVGNVTNVNLRSSALFSLLLVINNAPRHKLHCRKIILRNFRKFLSILTKLNSKSKFYLYEHRHNEFSRKITKIVIYDVL